MMFDKNSHSDSERIKKIVICGKSFVACASLEYVFDLFALKNAPYDLCACYIASDKGKDTWEPSFRKCASELGVPSVGLIGDVHLQKDDLIVSLEYDKMLREKDLNGAKAYNIHFSNLPRYRGCLTSVWPIRNLEPLGGVTLHIINPGVDDGPIIDQELFAIPKFWKCFDLYRAYNFYGYELFKKNIRSILDNSVSVRYQDQNLATLYKRNAVDFSNIDITEFNGPAESICAYIKSIIFPPYQLPKYQGKKIADCDVLIADRNRMHSVGALVYSDKRRAIVACTDRYIRILFEVQPEA